jgi:hypothetical protein
MWCSLAARVEPELLRALRLKGCPRTGAGVEADLWFSPIVESRSSDAIVLQPGAIEWLRQQLKKDPVALDRAWHLTRRFHDPESGGYPPLLAMQEEMTHLVLTAGKVEQSAIDDRLRRVLDTLRKRGAMGVAHWARRSRASLPAEVQQSPIYALLASESEATLRALAPTAAATGVQDWVDVRRLPLARVSLRWVGQGLEFGDLPAGGVDEARELRAPVTGQFSIEVPSTNPMWLSLVFEDRLNGEITGAGGGPQYSIRPRPLALPIGETVSQPITGEMALLVDMSETVHVVARHASIEWRTFGAIPLTGPGAASVRRLRSAVEAAGLPDASGPQGPPSLPVNPLSADGGINSGPFRPRQPMSHRRCGFGCQGRRKGRFQAAATHWT